MRLKIQKVMGVVLLAAFISGSAFALAPKKTEVREDWKTWTRTTPNGNDWVESEGIGIDCISAPLICQYLFPEGYDPNEHQYDDNMSAGAPAPNVESGYKPL